MEYYLFIAEIYALLVTKDSFFSVVDEISTQYTIYKSEVENRVYYSCFKDDFILHIGFIERGK